MTWGIGLKCPEGTLIATDSITGFSDDSFTVGIRRAHWLPGFRVALVVSGVTGDDHELGVIARYAEAHIDLDIRDQIRRSFVTIRCSSDRIKIGALRHGVELERDLPDPGPHVLYVGSHPGDEPQLARFTPRTETWAKVGDVLGIGAWISAPESPAEWRAELQQTTAPSTLAECRDLAVNWARRVVSHICGGLTLQAFIARYGVRPTVAFPVTAVGIAQNHYTIEEITWP